MILTDLVVLGQIRNEDSPAPWEQGLLPLEDGRILISTGSIGICGGDGSSWSYKSPLVSTFSNTTRLSLLLSSCFWKPLLSSAPVSCTLFVYSRAGSQ